VVPPTGTESEQPDHKTPTDRRWRGSTAGSLGRVAAAAICTFLAAATWAADAAPDADGQGDRIGYSLGYAFGEQLAGFRRLGLKGAPESIFRGVLDALTGAQPSLGREEMGKALASLRDPPAADNGESGAGPARTLPPARTRGFVDDFARLNAQRPGVVTLPSGVQYEVLKQGAGETPGPSDQVTVSYEGMLTNGVVFDTTRKDGEPARLRLPDIVVPGLREALMLMREGDAWRVVIPPSMGFGRTGNNMLRKRDLIYEIELVSVSPSETVAPATVGPGERDTGTDQRSPPLPAAAE
jgi:FKBP-type peptidyl-prolyl cis-trans isomerase FklB